jgi:hypothetical protein
VILIAKSISVFHFQTDERLKTRSEHDFTDGMETRIAIFGSKIDPRFPFSDRAAILKSCSVETGMNRLGSHQNDEKRILGAYL